MNSDPISFSFTLVIVVVTSLISYYGFKNKEFFYKYAHYPVKETEQGEYYRLLTSGFLHGDMFHLFINMYVLYIFGGYVERLFINILGGELVGRGIYLAFYLFVIILANLPTMAKHKNNSRYLAIGASGATSGIVFAFILANPMAMLGVFFIIPMPAVLFGILYLVYSSWASKKGQGNIDHDAHFYGAIAGFMFTLALRPALITDFFAKIINVF